MFTFVQLRISAGKEQKLPGDVDVNLSDREE